MLAGRFYLSPLREEKNPSFKVEQAGTIRHTIYDLFTKFTLLFTIQTPALKDIKVISLDQFDIYEK